MEADEHWRTQVHDKEMLEYWEGDAGYIFDCAWGVNPPKLFVPPASIWDACTPQLAGRNTAFCR